MPGYTKKAELILVGVWLCTFATCCGSAPTASDTTPGGTGATAHSNGNTPVLSRPPDTSYPMPPVTAAKSAAGWTLASAEHIKLSDYQGKVVVLDFYATWCGPCQKSIPHLVDLQNRYGSQGLQVIGLNSGGQDDYGEVPAFARKFQIQYPLGIPDPELENLYITDDGIPQTIIIDRNGRLVKKFLGYDDSMVDELDGVIQGSLSAAPTRSAGQ